MPAHPDREGAVMGEGPTSSPAALSPAEHRDLVQGLAAVVVEELEPDELAVFEETADEYFEDPQAVLDPKRRDEAVGFGLDAELLTPIVLAVAGPVVEYLTALVVEATGEGIKPTLVRMLRRMLRIREVAAETPVPEPPLLTQQQVEHVRSIAYARACDVGLQEDRARLLADAVAGGVRVGT
jgi:hypothetical protein